MRLINLEKRNDEIASVCCVDSDPEETIDEDVLLEASEQTELPADSISVEEDDTEIVDDELNDDESSDSDENEEI